MTKHELDEWARAAVAELLARLIDQVRRRAGR
jgi:hypothetical protein